MVYLYELDFRTCLEPIDTVLYLSPYRNGTANLVFGTQEYQYADIRMGAMTTTAGGTLMNPTLEFMAGSPADALLVLAIQGGLRGLSVVRKRTYGKFLASGSSPNANAYHRTTLFVNGLDRQMNTSITLKLTPAYGIEGINDISNRNLVVDSCALKYRVWDGTKFVYTAHADGGCPWGNPTEVANYPTLATFGTPYFDSANNDTANPAIDRCSLTAQGCMKRFPTGNIPIEAILSQATSKC
jgi:phage-related protein